MDPTTKSSGQTRFQLDVVRRTEAVRIHTTANQRVRILLVEGHWNSEPTGANASVLFTKVIRNLEGYDGNFRF